MKKHDKIIYDYVVSNCEKITVKSGKARINFKCHLNSVHEAINKKHEKIAMCMGIEKGFVYIHFVNVNKKGEFIDNTLGVWSQLSDFYLVKYVDKEEFWNVNDIFSSYNEYLRSKIPWYYKIFKTITY